MEEDNGWSGLTDFMVSGETGSLILWALVAYAAWAAIYRRRGGGSDRRDDDDFDGGD